MILDHRTEKLSNVAHTLKIISHPLRLAIIQILSHEQPLSVTEICNKLNSEQSLTSHHLNKLRTSGLIAQNRSGQNIMYKISNNQIHSLMGKLSETLMEIK